MLSSEFLKRRDNPHLVDWNTSKYFCQIFLQEIMHHVKKRIASLPKPSKLLRKSLKKLRTQVGNVNFLKKFTLKYWTFFIRQCMHH